MNRRVKQRTTIHLGSSKLRQRLMNKDGLRWKNKGVIQKEKVFLRRIKRRISVGLSSTADKSFVGFSDIKPNSNLIPQTQPSN